MITLTKPINRITIIKVEKSPKFIHEFNKNRATEEFLDTCKKAGKLFGKRK